MDETIIGDGKTGCIPHDAVDAAHRTHERPALGTSLVQPLEVLLLVRVELITAIEAGADRACEDVLLMEDGRFVRLFEELR